MKSVRRADFIWPSGYWPTRDHAMDGIKLDI